MCGTGGPEEQWRLFAETGSIWYYLDYKAQQRRSGLLGEDGYADCNDGAGAATGQGGGGRSDPDPSDT